jgi:uncharacterized protein
LSRPKYLLDANVLIALTDRDHQHYELATSWFEAQGRHDWGLCAFTEAAFLRITCNPRLGRNTVEDATDLLELLVSRPGYRFWPVSTSWTTLTAPFRDRIYGHQQITDAFLFGLAVQEDGVLVTMDKAIRHLAGEQLSRHLLVLA